MELVKKTLGQNYEDEEKKAKSTLEEIDEEISVSQIYPQEVAFIKKQFSNFSLNEKDKIDAYDSSIVANLSVIDEQDTTPPTLGSQGRSSTQESLEFAGAPDLTLTVSQIAKQFGLVQTFDTLEGHQKLNRYQLF